MDISMLHTSILLLSVACLTQGQYYDFFQGLTQIFQQYPQQTQLFTQHNNYNRPIAPNKKKNDDRRTKKPPIHQYEYVFATTTPKTSRKNTRITSSHTNLNKLNHNIVISDFITPNFEITTKRNQQTTRKLTDYYNNNKYTTGNVNNKNDYEAFNENGYKNDEIDSSNPYHQNIDTVNRNPNEQIINLGYNKPINFRNPDVNGIRSPNRDQSNNYVATKKPERIPTNQRNPDVSGVNIQNINNNDGTTRNPYFERPNQRNPSVVGISTNREIDNNDEIGLGYNNNGNSNNNYDSGNPIVTKPGVKPTKVDVNQPPITNRPATGNRPYDRPSQGGKERQDEPEIIIGPDENDMSEWQKRKYIDIAEKMCDRYKSLNVKEVAALPLLPSAEPVEFNVTSCVPISVPLVIGGKVVTINEFPHMALVGWKKSQSPGYSWKCGASLISDQYLLTAGHCTYQDKDYEVDSGPPQAVQLGSSYYDDPGAVVVKISAVIRHPKYKQRRSYFDLALIKMARTVRFTDVIKPACLGIPPSVGQNVIATGWGRTEFGGDHSEELRSVSVKVWNMSECREVWGTSLKLPRGPAPHSHVCAGHRPGGRDTCQGDSGGPAQIQDGCVWRVVAVTSFGRSCGAPNTPALYSVLKIPFISAQVFGNKQVIDEDRLTYEDHRQPVYNRQQGFTLRPTYVVNNFKRD